MPQQDASSNNPAVMAYNAVLVLFDVLVFLVKAIYIVGKGVFEMAVLPPARDVSGDIVLITGAGHGMGKNLSLQYAALGTTVVCVDVNEKTNQETVTAIKSKGGKAFGYTCDVTNRQQVVDICKKIREQVGIVSILINNAGIMPTHPLLQQTENEIRKTFDINVLAHFWFIQSLLPDMIKQNRGHIVVLSSIAGMIGFKYLVPYCGTKFAVRGIMEALSEELRADPAKPNVKFTTIYPYMVDTGLCKRPYTRFPNLLKMVKPDDAAAAIIDAQRRGLIEASIPKYLLYLNTWFRNMPLRVGQEFGDLLDTGLQSDLQTAAPNAGVKMYNLVILIIDIVAMLVRWIYHTLESFYRLVVPPAADTVHTDIVLITGAGHGMGRCMALQYAQLGATVVCVDINEKMNADTVATIRQQRGNAFGYVCDVTNRQQIIETAQQIRQEVGTVTILVNNAGIMPTHPLLQQTEPEIRKTFEINVMAHFWLLQSYLPGMLEKNRGYIVAMSSVAGLCGLNNLVPYCGSKFAVRGIMEALAEELRQDARNPNIKFTTVYPYMVDTGLCKRPHMRFPNLMRLVKPEEAAAAIIDGQRRGLVDVSIPKYLLYLNTIIRVFPIKVGTLLRDFLDSGVESDL
uniref:Short-chain dehydrogenase/reductase 3 n=1 Tax=Anopheles melas TaxID=34690 RepID=A0A182TE30_9DIPT